MTDADIETCARVAHEANRAFCVATGDPSQVGWDEAPEWQRASAREGVQHALRGATPEELHESWCEAKRRDGWTHGAVKDAVAKTHPCLVPYAELPEVQRRKDAIFGAVVRAAAPAR